MPSAMPHSDSTREVHVQLQTAIQHVPADNSFIPFQFVGKSYGRSFLFSLFLLRGSECVYVKVGPLKIIAALVQLSRSPRVHTTREVLYQMCAQAGTAHEGVDDEAAAAHGNRSSNVIRTRTRSERARDKVGQGKRSHDFRRWAALLTAIWNESAGPSRLLLLQEPADRITRAQRDADNAYSTHAYAFTHECFIIHSMRGGHNGFSGLKIYSHHLMHASRRKKIIDRSDQRRYIDV